MTKCVPLLRYSAGLEQLKKANLAVECCTLAQEKFALPKSFVLYTSDKSFAYHEVNKTYKPRFHAWMPSPYGKELTFRVWHPNTAACILANTLSWYWQKLDSLDFASNPDGSPPSLTLSFQTMNTLNHKFAARNHQICNPRYPLKNKANSVPFHTIVWF